MPTASQELRDKWGGYRGIGEDKAEDFLRSKGYTLLPNASWRLPHPQHPPSNDEIEAMQFLFEEWDYLMLEE